MRQFKLYPLQFLDFIQLTVVCKKRCYFFLFLDCIKFELIHLIRSKKMSALKRKRWQHYKCHMTHVNIYENIYIEIRMNFFPFLYTIAKFSIRRSILWLIIWLSLLLLCEYHVASIISFNKCDLIEIIIFDTLVCVRTASLH